jgi:hypothetical protein
MDEQISPKNNPFGGKFIKLLIDIFHTFQKILAEAMILTLHINVANFFSNFIP